jgi:hypothetical protein
MADTPASRATSYSVLPPPTLSLCFSIVMH